MGAFSASASVIATQFLEQSPLQSQRGAFSFTTRVDELHNFRVVPSAMLNSKKEATVVPEVASTIEKEATVVPEVASSIEKEAVKNVLTVFLRKQGLTNEAAATRTISKSDCFINHLVSMLHTIDKTRYLVGSELPILALEIRDAVVPYLESLLEEHGDIMVDVVENFPNSPDNEGPIFQASPTMLPLDSRKSEVMDPVSELRPVSELHRSGILPPVTLYLLSIGMDMDQIKEAGRKCPSFFDFSLEKQIKRTVELLLNLGMPQSDIPSFLCKAPHCFGSDPTPTFLYLRNLGFHKRQLLEMLKKYPRILECKRHKVKRIVDFLHELGLPTQDIVKVIGTMYPKVVTYSVDDRLWPPVAEYFHSIGVNVQLLFFRYPMVFKFSVEQDIKPLMEFLLDNGFSIEEIRHLAVRGAFFYMKKEKNLIPKWDFFLTMGYPRSELVKFPHYFLYSLERKIKPRYERMIERGVRLDLQKMLTANDSDFERILNYRVKKINKQQQRDAKTATTTTEQQQNSFPHPLLH